MAHPGRLTSLLGDVFLFSSRQHGFRGGSCVGSGVVYWWGDNWWTDLGNFLYLLSFGAGADQLTEAFFHELVKLFFHVSAQGGHVSYVCSPCLPEFCLNNLSYLGCIRRGCCVSFFL